MKRGASPVGLSSSLSSSRLKESESSYSIRRAGESTLERSKPANGTKSVLFATENNTFSSPSSSSYSISEQLKVNRNHISSGAASATSTSQLIKQTLSPLAQHRLSAQPSTAAATVTSNSAIDAKLNHRPAYQFPLNSSGKISANSRTNHADDPTLHAAIKSSSPSRPALGNSFTNTLPSSIARSMLYQSESNYSMKNPATSVTSSGNGVGGPLAAAQGNTIYGTLPKSINSHSAANSTNGASAPGAAFGSVSAVANEFEQIIARNASQHSNSFNTHASHNSSGAGNYNTLGSYRVQYSSTNPFLQHLDPQTSESGATNGADK